LVTVPFETYQKSVAEALDAIEAHKQIAVQSRVLIKPNLINASPHPITTSPACCEAIIEYVRSCSDARIVIAEGCGARDPETGDVFRRLGYEKLAQTRGIEPVGFTLHAQ
jgi:uncharacterized protein (DUF362 family)